MSDQQNKQIFKEKVRALHASFVAKIPAKMDEIDAAWKLCEQDPAAQDHWSTLHRLLHTLAGSSGSFGFAELGVRARAIEMDIKAMTASGATPSTQQQAALQAQLAEFTQWALDHRSDARMPV